MSDYSCRICLLPATMQMVSLHVTFGSRSVAEMVRFVSGIQVNVKKI